nr:RAB6-interacting golgin [Onthophagus taurus]
MSGKFVGFSDDDIKNVQNNEPSNKNTQNLEKPKAKKPPQKVVIRLDPSRTKILEKKSTIQPESTNPEHNKQDEVKNQGQNEETVNLNNNPSENESNMNNNLQNTEPKRFINLDEFQLKQKQIEEANNHRKELLAKALADRTKRTQEEAKRLGEIQEEFKKLDMLLSNDVKILRKKIELASLHYMEAQKQYLQVEKAFLAAKISLQQQLEKKELLTEHLCQIIEQNEERKAKKLMELLNRLNLNDSEDTKCKDDKDT